MRCVQVIAGVLGKAGEEGQFLRRQMAEEKKDLKENSRMQPTMARMDPISGRIMEM